MKELKYVYFLKFIAENYFLLIKIWLIPDTKAYNNTESPKEFIYSSLLMNEINFK